MTLNFAYSSSRYKRPELINLSIEPHSACPYNLPRIVLVEESTHSDKSLEQARSWILNCASSHPGCAPDVPSLLPTRVIDVGTNDLDIRLYETAGESNRYICLSHCWGRSQILVTTHDTIEQHKKNIPSDKLPKTFRDAIDFTRRLGIRWI